MVEVTTKYATTVDDIPAAFSFIMSKIDTVGPNPRISISPIHVQPVSLVEMMEDPDEDHGTWKREFEVVVSGMVEQPDES